MSIRQMIKSN